MKEITALIVIDCQNDFITGSLANLEADKKIPNIVKKINDFNGIYIYVTRDTHEKNYLKTIEGMHLPIIHCIKDTWGWEIDDRVKTALNTAISRGINVVYINKPTFGSLELMKQIDVDMPYNTFKIEVCGFVSSICVISNALLLKSAFYDRANIIVDTSCIAGISEENNKAAIEILNSCQIETI